MLFQILIGSVLIILTIIVQVLFIEKAIQVLTRFGSKISGEASTRTFVIALTFTTLWLLAALTIATWIWAVAFMGLGAFDTLSKALYFSMVSFTTLGYGDITLTENLQLLSGFIAANGLVLFGLNTAFLIEVMSRFRGGETK